MFHRRFATNLIPKDFILISVDGINKGKTSLIQATSLLTSKQKLQIVNSTVVPNIVKIVPLVDTVKPKQPTPNNTQKNHIKEIHFNTTIGIHDLEIKMKKAVSLLNDMYKVQIVITTPASKNKGALRESFIDGVKSFIGTHGTLKEPVTDRNTLKVLILPKS